MLFIGAQRRDLYEVTRWKKAWAAACQTDPSASAYGLRSG